MSATQEQLDACNHRIDGLEKQLANLDQQLADKQAERELVARQLASEVELRATLEAGS